MAFELTRQFASVWLPLAWLFFQFLMYVTRFRIIAVLRYLIDVQGLHVSTKVYL